ncbi:hypothetical protein BJ165DRAFT_1529488 [Panaeolus papilionaceus]|nr:hypothetical protein BJ165DRAFT_1529488 [Panaeolus papilionaceus]
MPYKHSHTYPCKKDTYHSVQSRVYQAESPTPHFRNLMTHNNGAQHFALTQSVLHHEVQPYTHFREATVMDHRKRHNFYIFFKNHCRLPINESVRKLTGVEWHGNIVIMRGSAKGNGLVNMRGKDAQLSDFLLKRLVHSIRQGKRISRPRQLVYVWRS